MRGKLARTLITAAAAFAVAAPLAAAAAASQAGGPALKVGPKQHVRGFVNTKNSKAVIRVICPGPASTGHPLSRQSVRVARAIDPIARNDGFTGTAATSIGAWLTWPTTVAPPPPAYIATFTGYGAMPIPTSITVPCGGSGEMLFLPAPGSRTVKAATVGVTFVNIGA
jgi:hypothetical protein